MKYFFFILLFFVSAISMAQSDVEQALNNAEQELYRLEQVKSDMAKELIAKGEIPNMNEQFLQAEQAYKTQLSKTKALRKQFKKEQRAKKRTQVANAPQGASQGRPSSAPVYNPNRPGNPGQAKQPKPIDPIKEAQKQRKAEIKALNQQIKQLKKEQKVLIAQAEANGQNPMSLPSVQEYDRRIMAKQEELVRLKATPLDPTVKNAQNVPMQQPTVQPSQSIEQVALPNTGQKPKKEKKPKKVKPLVNQPAATPPQPPVPPMSQSQPVTAEQPAIEVPAIGLSTILFEKFSTDIPSKYELYLNHVAKQMQDNPALLLHISSFTDNSEKNKVSMQITAGMANSVAQAMVNRGVSPARLVVKANGSRKPVADNGTYFGQARNRRVELSFGY